LTEDELILSLCREAKQEGPDEDLIKGFRGKYGDQAELIMEASRGDTKALMRLRWLLGLKVIT
jgi:hypothetical protein